MNESKTAWNIFLIKSNLTRIHRKFPRPLLGGEVQGSTEDLVQTAARDAVRELTGRMKPGMSVAVTAGSSSIADIVAILRGVIEEIRSVGAEGMRNARIVRIRDALHLHEVLESDSIRSEMENHSEIRVSMKGFRFRSMRRYRNGSTRANR